MIPEFKVTLNNSAIDIAFDNTVPQELALWIKETVLQEFKGLPLTPQVAEQIGSWVNGRVRLLVNNGMLYLDPIKDEWRLKEKLIEWSQDGTS